MSKHRKLKKAKRSIEKRTHSKKLTKFHIIPKAIGGKSSTDNVSFVPEDIHRNYHNLFELKTPEEVIEYLVEDFWNGNWSFVEEALQNHCLEEVGYDL